MDTRTVERKVNQFKAKVEARRGPAGHSQRDVPILDGIRNFHAHDSVSLAIPAHKSGCGAPADAQEVLGEQVFWADQTMLNGVDNGRGRIAAEFFTPYPPGIPLSVPGERITPEIVDYLNTGSAEGMYAEGCADQSLSTLRVTA